MVLILEFIDRDTWKTSSHDKTKLFRNADGKHQENVRRKKRNIFYVHDGEAEKKGEKVKQKIILCRLYTATLEHKVLLIASYYMARMTAFEV